MAVKDVKEARARIEEALADVPVGSARPVEVLAADVAAVCGALSDAVATALYGGAVAVLSPLVREVCVQEDQLRHVLRLSAAPKPAEGPRADV
jgi:hypothetical protein